MSPRIAVLEGAVADQIAAGEVVERPASVVKELVENALDAGATRVDIEVVEGGKDGVRVSDDGCGMDRDDAILALERHATSKIRRAEDLVGVRSFGFRGEALPAICSISELQVATSPVDGEGTEINARAGSVVSVRDAARRRGTTVQVSGIFHNAPARRKFLRAGRTEWRGVIEAVTALALNRRDVHFSLANDGKTAFVLPPSASLRDRVVGLFGAEYASRFLVVDDVSGTIHVSGLVERPADVGTASRRVHLTVNGRAVRDFGIVRAAEAAFRTTIPDGMRPSVLLEIELTGDAVDVNVHPAKAEVRFRDRWQVERAVEMAVRRALGTTDAAAGLGRSYWKPARPGPAPGGVDVEALRARPAWPFFEPDASSSDAVGLAAATETLVDAGVPAPAAIPSAAPDAGRQDEDIPALMQLHRTYLQFEREDGVVLIDQHSAHERVLFERFMRALERGEAPAQRLLFPLTLHLSADESEAFESARDGLERLGFEIEGFGGQTLIVSSVPLPHPRFDAERCLRDTLSALAGNRAPSDHSQLERVVATVACKAAVKGGDALSLSEMRALFVALRDTTLPAHDVHGRSTIVFLSWDELERRFGRK